MARIQLHHITYDPPWIVELNMLMHRTISRIQQTRATPEQYALLVNYNHAVSWECNRMRMELDTKRDCRVVNLAKKRVKSKEG